VRQRKQYDLANGQYSKIFLYVNHLNVSDDVAGLASAPGMDGTNASSASKATASQVIGSSGVAARLTGYVLRTQAREGLELRIAANLNMCLCYLQLQRLDRALEACQRVRVLLLVSRRITPPIAGSGARRFACQGDIATRSGLPEDGRTRRSQARYEHK